MTTCQYFNCFGDCDDFRMIVNVKALISKRLIHENAIHSNGGKSFLSLSRLRLVDASVAKCSPYRRGCFHLIFIMFGQVVNKVGCHCSGIFFCRSGINRGKNNLNDFFATQLRDGCFLDVLFMLT